MKHEDIDADLQELAFLFFHKYSRFEFALKENGYLRDRNPGSPAIPGWREFASARYAAYCLSPESKVVAPIGEESMCRSTLLAHGRSNAQHSGSLHSQKRTR